MAGPVNPEDVVAQGLLSAEYEGDSYYEWPCEEDGYYAPSVHTVAVQAVAALRAAGLLPR